jgi:NAD(P)-dependent dehydrogenase (short-subunit alcohol dehydrogenase family)
MSCARSAPMSSQQCRHPREKPVPVTEQTSDSYAATFDTTVLGTLLSLKHEMQLMQPQSSGTIVNISSTSERGAANLSLCINPLFVDPFHRHLSSLLELRTVREDRRYCVK